MTGLRVVAFAALAFACNGDRPGSSRVDPGADASDAMVDAGDREDVERDAMADVPATLDADGSTVGPDADTETSAPDAERCLAQLTCGADGEPLVSGTPIVAFGDFDPLDCTLTNSQTADDPPSWQVAFEDGRTVPLRASRTSPERIAVPFGARSLFGTLFVEASTADCEYSSGPYTVLPPGAGDPGSEAVYITLEWTTEGALDADLDLRVLRHPDECWSDPLHALSPGRDSGYDWGEPGPDDDPVIGNDMESDGIEFLYAPLRSPIEPWRVAARIYEHNGGTVAATVTIRVGGDVVLVVERELPADVGWWDTAEVSDGRWTATDLLSAAAPACDIADRCPDGTGAPETCNGADDDCDGEIDENPDACYNSGEGRLTCQEVRIGESDPFYDCF